MTNLTFRGGNKGMGDRNEKSRKGKERRGDGG